jgi:thiamine biosynthesis lipoprotein
MHIYWAKLPPESKALIWFDASRLAPKNLRFFAAAFIAQALLLASCVNRPPAARSEFIFGTVCTLRIEETGKARVYNDVFERLREIDDVFSANKQGTAVDEINRSAGISPVIVGDEVIYVLDRALFFAELSDGNFDPSIGPLVKLWGIGSENPRVPDAEETERALSFVNWRDVVIDHENKTVFLKTKGMALDLGGIVKGYAADQALEIIKAAGVKGALIDLGGNIIVYGKKAGTERPWNIGIQDPYKERGEFIGIIEVKEGALVTSGGYERFFEEDGRRYHHILSTKTGRPIESDLVSVTIIQSGQNGQNGQNEMPRNAAMDADALSTTLFALGYEKGSAFIGNFAGMAGAVDAVFVLQDGKIRTTSGLEGRFTVKKESAAR